MTNELDSPLGYDIGTHAAHSAMETGFTVLESLPTGPTKMAALTVMLGGLLYKIEMVKRDDPSIAKVIDAIAASFHEAKARDEKTAAQ